MMRLAYLVLMAALAVSLCGCGGGHSDGIAFDGFWEGTFSDSAVSLATEAQIDVYATDPSAPLDEREYTFSGSIWNTGSEPGHAWAIIVGSISGTIDSHGRMTVEYHYGSNPSVQATGRADVINRPLLNGIPHMVGTIYTYGEGGDVVVAQQDFDLIQGTQ